MYKKIIILLGNSIRCVFSLAFFSVSVTATSHSFAQMQQTEVPNSTKATDSKAKSREEGGNPDTEKAANSVLPTIVIEAKDNGEVIGNVAKRSATATKTGTPIIETPQSITVVTRNEMDMRSVQHLTEALRYVPGVTVDQFGFDGRGFEYLFMRGFNATTTANFRDGLSNAAKGLFFAEFITDTFGLERVDVLRGPASVLYGRGDAGGIVNRITKRPTAAPIREVEFQYGNFERERFAADLGVVSKDGTIMMRLVTTALDSDTQVRYPNTGGDRAHNERFYIAPSITFRPNAMTSLTLMGDMLNNRSGSSPFYITAPDGRFTNVLQSDPKFARYSTNQATFSYQFEHHFNEILTVRQNFRYASQKGRFQDLFALGYNDPDRPTLMDRGTYATNERLNQAVLDTHLQAKIATGPVNHTMLLGVDWNQTNAFMRYFEGYNSDYVPPPIDIDDPVYGAQPILRPDLLVQHSKQRIDQLGFYIQDQLKYDNWVLTLSGRHDRLHTKDSDLLNESVIRNKNNAFTGRAGLTYLFANGIAPYFSYSQSFMPQPGVDAESKPFDPSRASQYEAGIKFQPTGGKSLYTVAFFDLTKTNALTRDVNDPTGVHLMQTGEVRSRGVELEGRSELLRGLNVISSFTYLDVDNIKDTDFKGKRPIQVPTTMASGWLDYSFGALGYEWLKGFGLGGGVRYVGSTFNDQDNTSTTPSFTLFDATLRYERGPMLFNINASNIFDKHYVSTSFFNRYYLGTERTIIGTLTFRF